MTCQASALQEIWQIHKTLKQQILTTRTTRVTRTRSELHTRQFLHLARWQRATESVKLATHSSHEPPRLRQCDVQKGATSHGNGPRQRDKRDSRRPEERGGGPVKTRRRLVSLFSFRRVVSLFSFRRCYYGVAGQGRDGATGQGREPRP